MLMSTAREIVERYVLAAGETVTGAAPLEQVALVTVSSGGWQWQVSPVERLPGAVQSREYLLYEVRPYVAADPMPRPLGVAVLADGAMYPLGGDDGFGTFWKRACAWMPPLELAALLARYGGGAPARRQNLIVTRADVADLLLKKQTEGLPGWTELRAQAGENGGGSLDFCTFYLDQQPPDYVPRVGLNRWRVEWDAGGALRWSVRPIAQGLDSPLYYSPPEARP